MLMLIWRRSAGTPLAPVIAENCADRKSANATQIAGFPTVVVDAVRACKFIKWQAAAHRLLFRLCRMLPRWVSGTLYSRQRDQRFYTNDAVMCVLTDMLFLMFSQADMYQLLPVLWHSRKRLIHSRCSTMFSKLPCSMSSERRVMPS